MSDLVNIDPFGKIEVSDRMLAVGMQALAEAPLTCDNHPAEIVELLYKAMEDERRREEAEEASWSA